MNIFKQTTSNVPNKIQIKQRRLTLEPIDLSETEVITQFRNDIDKKEKMNVVRL